MSVFNPQQFMETSVDGANSTALVPVPIGEYTAIVDDVKPPRSVGQDGAIVLDLVWEITDDEVKQALDREKVTVKQSLWLDLNDSGGLDMGKGKNVGLGRLREALGMNSGGFNFNMLKGAGPAKLKISHRENKDDPANPYAQVQQVGKIG